MALGGAANNLARRLADCATDDFMELFKTAVFNGEFDDGPEDTNRVEIAVCSIPTLLAMKGHAVQGRYKQKDAYDIYYCVRNYPDGIEALAEACRPLLALASGERGYRYIAEKFDTVESYGPICVRLFVEDTRILGERSPDQWQQDAFGQVDARLRALGLRA